MDLYPLDLVLAAALASATVFLGSLPIRTLLAPFFTRQVLWAGLAWMIMATASPASILHFHLLLGALCLIAWWKLGGDHGLSGKLWFTAAAALGISLGVVLILAVTPGAYPSEAPAWRDALFLASLYLGGAVTGLAYVVYVLTRREAPREGVSASSFARLLVGLTLARAATFLALFLAQAHMEPAPWTPFERLLGPMGSQVVATFIFGSILLALPGLARMALKRTQSPAPSTAGSILLTLCLLSLVTETLLRWR